MLPRIVGAIAAVAVVFGMLVAVVRSDGLEQVAVANDRVVDVSGFVGVESNDLFASIADADSEQLTAVAAMRPDALLRLLDAPPPADRVAEWWETLRTERRAELVDLLPELVGNLEGVPFGARDEANRAHLVRLIAETESALEHAIGRAERSDLVFQRELLGAVEAASANDGGPQRQLVSLDPRDVGRATVVFGDLDVADHVTLLVPGMFFTVHGQLGYWTDFAHDLHVDATDVLGVIDEARRIATVAWLGYRTPDFFTVASLDRAEEGATALSATVDGMRAVRDGDDLHLTVVAHSYGSTAASIALADGRLAVDAFVMIGSPGVAGEHVSDLGLATDVVYVVDATADPVAGSGALGTNPAAAEFGATVVSSSASVASVTGRLLGEAVGHMGYFDRAAAPMHVFALIGTGHALTITDAPAEGERVPVVSAAAR